MKKDEYELINRLISWIENERRKPRKKQDSFYLQSICYYLSDLYDTDCKRDLSERYYPVISESFHEYLTSEGQRYVEFLEKRDKKKIIKKLRRRKKVISVTVIVLAALLMATVISYALGFDPFEYIKEFLGISVGEQIAVEDDIYIRSGDAIYYNTVEELCEDMDISILYPTYIPENILINNIRVANNLFPNKEIDFVFSSNNIMYLVYTYEIFNINKLIDRCVKYEMGGIAYYIFQDVSSYIVYFEYENNQYILHYPEYDEVIKIIDNIKECMLNEKID